jgi:hypothetical protein
MMYGAYFDESDQSPGFSLAGFSASYDTWLHLRWRWDELLKKWNISCFKASECENLLEEFAQYRAPQSLKGSRLNDREFKQMVEIKTDFIDAICKHGDDLQGYGAVVVVKDFERIISEDATALRYLRDKPYYVCFQLCLVAAGRPAWDTNLTRSAADRVHIRPMFDSHDEYSDLAVSLYDDFKAKNPKSSEFMLPPRFDDDRFTSPIQVADNLAYEVRKLLTQKIQNPSDTRTRKSLKRLRPFIYRVYKLDYNALKLIVARQPIDSVPVRHVRVEELWTD